MDLYESVFKLWPRVQIGPPSPTPQVERGHKFYIDLYIENFKCLFVLNYMTQSNKFGI